MQFESVISDMVNNNVAINPHPVTYWRPRPTILPHFMDCINPPTRSVIVGWASVTNRPTSRAASREMLATDPQSNQSA